MVARRSARAVNGGGSGDGRKRRERTRGGVGGGRADGRTDGGFRSCAVCWSPFPQFDVLPLKVKEEVLDGSVSSHLLCHLLMAKIS